MRISALTRIVITGFVSLVCTTSFVWSEVPTDSQEGDESDSGGEVIFVRTVLKVVDGDTLVLANGDRVRLIGVDTPEIIDEFGRNEASARRTGRDVALIREYALRARDFVREMLEGEEVRLEYEPANAVIHHRDEFGRILAYVYRAEDDLFINSVLIEHGYGLAFTFFPSQYRDQFKALEDHARKKHMGLWS